MSDTQGANLEGDMPGIDTAQSPPTTGIARSPLQLPSALQGLAKFQQSQGKPAPKFQPPKPPALTEEQARLPPQHTGKPASFAPVPATVNVPTGGFTPFIKTQDKRDISQWGDAVRYPRLPATFELGGMFNQIGQYFAQAGGDVGEAASQLTYHSQAYWDGFMKGQDHKMKMAIEQQALYSKQLENSITNRLIDNKNTIDSYMRAAGGDATKLGSVRLNGVDLYHALYDVALKNQDEQAQRMLEAGEPLEHVINYLHDADKNLRDLQAARQKAGDQEADDAAAYGLGPKAGTGGAGSGWEQTAPRDQATQPPATAPKEDDPNAPDWAKGLDPKLVAATEDAFRGSTPSPDKTVARAAATHAKEMDVAVNKILDDAHAGRIKPDEVMPAIRKAVGPRIAADAEGVANYSRPGFGSGAGGSGSQRQGDYAQLLDAIARAANPGDKDGVGGFVATHYKEQEDFRNNNQIRTALIRTRDLPAMADEVKQDISILRNKQYNMNDLNWQGVKDHFVAGNPDFQKLYSDMLAYSTAYQTIISGGRATLGGTRDVEASFPSQSPLATYFNVIKGHMGGVRGILSGYHADWESKGGKPTNMPRGDPAIEKRIDNYWRMDPNTGAFPYDPNNPDNDRIKKKAGPWGPAGDYYWTNADPVNRNNPRNWMPVK
jgi:hypothetical protein